MPWSGVDRCQDRYVVDHVTDDAGELDEIALGKLCGDIVAARAPRVTRSCVVMSGAIAAGMPALGPHDPPHRHRHAASDRRGGSAAARRTIERAARAARHRAGQVLLTPYDFVHRSQYLHARQTFNDYSSSACSRSSTRTTPSPTTRSATATTTVSPHSWRTSRSRRHAALAHRHRAACSRPTHVSTTNASLIEEIVEVDAALEAGGRRRGQRPG